MSSPPQPGRGGLVGSAAVVLTVLGLAFVHAATAGMDPLVRAGLGSLVATGGVAWMLGRFARVDAPAGRFDARTTLTAVAVGAGLALFGVGAMSLQVVLFPGLEPMAANYAGWIEQIVQPDVPGLIPAVFVAVALLPGICEEWLFRGVVRRSMMAWSPGARVLVVGLLFALVHMSPIVLLPLFYVGCVLTAFAERVDGWGPPALAHVTLNAINGIVMVRLLADVTLGLLPSLGFFVVGAAVATLALALPHKPTP